MAELRKNGAPPIIATSADLAALVERMSGAEFIAFDTEFVSEFTYRPTLCLVQVAFGDELAAIDAMAIEDLRPFWSVVTSPGHVTIVHAGRQELLFCLGSVGLPPANLFDVQLAAGMVGLEFPAGYGNLVSKLLGVTPQKGETRTDWRRRPLTDRQIQYALEDVRQLRPLYEFLVARLKSLGRLAWHEAEMRDWQADVSAYEASDRWRKVAGSSSLHGRGQAIVREVWKWREEEAERLDRPAKRILRDDLIVELAKRRVDDRTQIQAIRGMERGDLSRAAPKIAAAVSRALNLSEAELPRLDRVESNSRYSLLGQFMNSALSIICRESSMAASLLGSANDVRDWIAYRLDGGQAEPPALARGWRAEFVGRVLDDLLAGGTAIRVSNPRSDQPLTFFSRKG